ncbi:MAG: FAD-dependent oxidoreductase [Deltaproteobacteria bacterium]|nr:FAD-dependent oxidoreductase [Deltaproteobacteria bacterium]
MNGIQLAARLMVGAMVVLSAGCAVHSGSGDFDPEESVSDAVNSNLSCDVIVAGGTTAALSAALTAAREGVKTCLVEPTDWPGGQLTAGGVPAVDFAWHKVDGYDVGAIAKKAENLPAEFVKWMNAIGNPGGCWVSKNCYEPKALLAQQILPAISQTPNLTVLKNTVVKRVTTSESGGQRRIKSVVAIRRTARNMQSWGGYDVPLSQDLDDWYDVHDSPRFTKETITMSSQRAAGPVVVDATEFGEVMVLSRAAWLQGVEESDGSTTSASELCGQAFVYPFVVRYNDSAVADNAPAGQPDHPEFYGMGNSSWEKIWTYRRVKGSGSSGAGQLSNQNWNPGNDYAYGYLLQSRAQALAEVDDWKGGVNHSALEAAERHAWGWYRWYRSHAPQGVGSKLSLASDVFGTAHGLSKYPYVRDTRRSIGVDDFVLSGKDLEGPASALTGKRFIDRIAIGVYNGDIHPMKGCSYPGYVSSELQALPFYIPLRALTNRDVANLLVAGKTMAQSFRANAAIRLHPIEFSSGIGAGAAAATMVSAGIDDTRSLVEHYAWVQTRVKKYAPISWTIQGKQLPGAGEVLEPLHGGSGSQPSGVLFCPPGAHADLGLGFCVDDQNAYGPFTKQMVDHCVQYGGGPACQATMDFVIDGHKVSIPRWGKSFAVGLRGNGACMHGAHKDSTYTSTCVEDAGQSSSGNKEAYGPFSQDVVTRCLQAAGGDACYTNRYRYAFFASLQP